MKGKKYICRHLAKSVARLHHETFLGIFKKSLKFIFSVKKNCLMLTSSIYVEDVNYVEDGHFAIINGLCTHSCVTGNVISMIFARWLLP